MKLPPLRTLQAVALLVLLTIIILAAHEFYLSAPQAGAWFGKLSANWGLAWVGFIAGCLAGWVFLCVDLWTPSKLERIEIQICYLRQSLGIFRTGLAGLALILPTYFLLFTHWGEIFSGLAFRFLMLLTASLAFAALTTPNSTRLAGGIQLLLGFALVGSVYVMGERFSSVSNFPFSLTWSEGNRLYDFSVYVNSSRYIYPGMLTIPYHDPGRYLLWGIPFLVPNSPIWLHRLWDALLWTVPFGILGLLLVRRAKIDCLRKWLLVLWVFLFLSQGPIYTPLVLSAILIVAVIGIANLWFALVGTAIAGYYAAISRWTWLPAPAAWGGSLWLAGISLKGQKNLGRLAKQLLPVAGLIAAGLLGASLGNPKFFSPQKLAASTALKQPMLWERLLPNPTLPEGILIAIGVASGPLIILLIWMAAKRTWEVAWLQRLAFLTTGLVFLGMGIVASVKIGGGSNLHNFDMFLVTLTLLAGLALRSVNAEKITSWPDWARGLLALAILLPSFHAIRQGSMLNVPDDQMVQEALQLITKKVNRASQRGEVLFIDQRQLLTFGYIQGVPLVSEYEKKYLMDQAMQGNANFFKQFYADLARGRFSMIVSEPLYTNEQDASHSFQAENNAWVIWVARPLLCYYAPVETIPEVRVQLLVPRADSSGCP